MNERAAALAREAGICRDSYDFCTADYSQIEALVKLVARDCATAVFDASNGDAEKFISAIMERYGL